MSRITHWFRGRWDHLLALAGTPHSVALGFAIGLFWGLTPLFGVKTLAGFASAWTLRANRAAAVIGVTLPDVLLPVWPVILHVEYVAGCVVMGRPPQNLEEANWVAQLDLTRLFGWTNFLDIGLPFLLGSVAVGVPVGAVAYFFTRSSVRRMIRRSERRRTRNSGSAGPIGP